MKTYRTSLRSALITVMLLCGLGAVTRASAQDSDGWSFVLTPQIWASHIAKNGFVAPGTLGAAAGTFSNDFRSENSAPTNSIDPQWGLQIAAQKGRWSLAGAVQYVSFETRSDIVYTPLKNNLSLCGLFTCLNPGERAAQEFVNTTRLDMDFAISYLFPDVVQNRLDLSVGGGVKIIYASASREHANLSGAASELSTILPAFLGRPGNGLYLICEKDNCTDSHFQDRVKSKALLYGATIPISAVFHLTDDATWLLGLNTTPFIGAETRDDRDVVYSANANGTVNRLDGTTLAYGVTTDVTLRHILNESLSVYAGARVQYIKGHEKFLAYGPLFGMSVRFGGK